GSTIGGDVVMEQQVAAFYVDAEDIGSDGLTEVGFAAALPSINADGVTVRPGDGILVVDALDNVASAVVVEKTGATVVLRVKNDWVPMSLADVEIRAIVGAVLAIRRGL